MLTSQTDVFDFEDFALSNQPFTIEELSVRGFFYNDTIPLKPSYPLHLVYVKAQKSLLGLRRIYTLWTGTLDFTPILFYTVFFLSFKICFPKHHRLRQSKQKVFVFAEPLHPGHWFGLPQLSQSVRIRAELQPQLSQSQHFSHEIIAHGENRTCFFSG